MAIQSDRVSDVVEFIFKFNRGSFKCSVIVHDLPPDVSLNILSFIKISLHAGLQHVKLGYLVSHRKIYQLAFSNLVFVLFKRNLKIVGKLLFEFQTVPIPNGSFSSRFKK